MIIRGKLEQVDIKERGYIKGYDMLYSRDKGIEVIATIGQRNGHSFEVLLTLEEWEEINPRCSHCGHTGETDLEITIKRVLV